MFKKIKDWFISKSLVCDDVITSSIKTEQVDQRDIETRKRVKKAFEQQEHAIKCRAIKAHDPSCSDVILCKKRKCFKVEPDKIVSEPYDVKRGE